MEQSLETGDWQAFLDRELRMTKPDPETVQSASPRTADLLVPVCDESVLRVAGADAATFLHGQLSTDIEAMQPGEHHLSSWNSARGRVLSTLRILRREEDFLLFVPDDLAATVLTRLRMFILRARVELADLTDQVARIGVCGPGVGQWVDSLRTDSQVTVLRLAGSLPRIEFLGPPRAVVSAWNRLKGAGAMVAEGESWRHARILAGEPRTHEATSDEFVAQMLGLHELGAIDFRKGCYPGQEIIARLQYRGTLKKRLVAGSVSADRIPAPGAVLERADTRAGIGTIVEAAGRPPHIDFLAVVSVEALENSLEVVIDGHGVTWQ
ncbi:MAG: hypothetical protein PVJ40_08635 [Gammaproteobacteria bacterium]|jgi:hypothetical protein